MNTFFKKMNQAKLLLLVYPSKRWYRKTLLTAERTKLCISGQNSN